EHQEHRKGPQPQRADDADGERLHEALKEGAGTFARTTPPTSPPAPRSSWRFLIIIMIVIGSVGRLHSRNGSHQPLPRNRRRKSLLRPGSRFVFDHFEVAGLHNVIRRRDRDATTAFRANGYLTRFIGRHSKHGRTLFACE